MSNSRSSSDIFSDLGVNTAANQYSQEKKWKMKLLNILILTFVISESLYGRLHEPQKDEVNEVDALKVKILKLIFSLLRILIIC